VPITTSIDSKCRHGAMRRGCGVVFLALAFLAFGGTAAASASPLTLSQSGYGHGTVTFTVAPVPSSNACSTPCQLGLSDGTLVTVTAHPADDSTFSGWTGGCTGTSATCTVAVGAVARIIANFALRFPVALNVASTTGGYVVGESPYLLCGDGRFFSCQIDIAAGTAFKIQAVPSTGFAFTGWSGDCTGTADICTLSMTEPRSVTPTFTPLLRLSIMLAGTGYGSVTSNPGALTCGSFCTGDFISGSVVTLTAVPQAGAIFAGWGGDCAAAGASVTCSLSMLGAHNVIATFNTPPVHLVVTKAGTGSGSVTSSFGGIDCGATCDGDAPSRELVTLTAVAAPGSTFTGWTGDCGGAATSCKTMFFEDSRVTATFSLDETPPADTTPPAGPGPQAGLFPSSSSPVAGGSAVVSDTTSAASPASPVAAGPANTASRAKADVSLRARPKVIGRAKVGRTLTCTRGSWNGSPTSYAFSWIRDGRIIGHGSRHLVRAADQAHALHCQVTARNSNGARTASSAARHVPPAFKEGADRWLVRDESVPGTLPR
jgi:hypothetical protein